MGELELISFKIISVENLRPYLRIKSYVLLLRPLARMMRFSLLVVRVLPIYNKKREVRTLLLILCSWPSNLPSQKDKQLRSPRRYEYSTPKKGDAYKHIPRTSTIASSLLSKRVFEVRNSAMKRSSKRLSTLSSDSHSPPTYRIN